ncbi:hypothetical protein [Flavobacterium sp. ENC]|uniref:hypothetical protein n=1 Tax=Flavobacterium sp. ENC TaxID=2897330 RepID=UPI001E4C9A12|nr:hypothetical protein [Flavobacterium sp. ENC]MCD0466261.1 hypothetical protein [Flavobacterium sp. ENC]
MSDLISASSLLLAILTTLFGTYYSSINEILNLEPNNFKDDDKANYAMAKIILKTKLIPLLLSSIFLTAIFIPKAIELVITSYNNVSTVKFEKIKYDTISTSYIAVTIFMISLTINIIIIASKFYRKMKSINPNRN